MLKQRIVPSLLLKKNTKGLIMYRGITHENYYRSEIEEFGSTAEGAGWKNKHSQFIRFKQLVRLIPTEECTLNDLGCGFGHLYEYIQHNDPKNINYRGYDISVEMINKAKLLHPVHDRQCNFFHIFDIDEMPIVDFTVSSGIFNLKGSTSESKWLSYILSTIEEMDKKSRKGFGFNMLTKYSDSEHMDGTLYYSDPCFFFDFCKKNYSKNVALLHDYNEYDFTILIKKT